MLPSLLLPSAVSITRDVVERVEAVDDINVSGGGDDIGVGGGGDDIGVGGGDDIGVGGGGTGVG